jgi:hypothetical protein
VTPTVVFNRANGFQMFWLDDVFRSNATARNVFGRARPATNSRKRSTSGSPSRYRTTPDDETHLINEGKDVPGTDLRAQRRDRVLADRRQEFTKCFPHLFLASRGRNVYPRNVNDVTS